ncbi:MAG: B12-binding domain-containing radical SAM protein [Oscillospiraceae bacterium]|nr:B12-binding domain-containing radical SAM protein [Oscillospiraceae bacterium]
MKVLLINPRVGLNRFHTSLPLGMLAIGSYLKSKGYTVRTFDRCVQRENFIKIFDEFKPDVVGFSIFSFDVVKDAMKISAYARKSGIPVVLGGGFSTILAREFLSENIGDYVVLGEGEITMDELLQRIERGADVDDVAGLAYVRDGSVRFTCEREFCDLRQLPKLDWSLVKPSNYYTFTFPGSQNAIYIYHSKGCPGRCSFCFNKSFHKSMRRLRSDEAVCAEIRELVDTYGADGVIFGDECFCANKEEMLAFCEKLASLDILWACQTRPTLTRQEVQAMYDSGCRTIFFGVESGSPRMQKEVQKNLPLERVKETFELCREIGIYTVGSFILGLPGETREDMLQTLEFINEIKPDLMQKPFFLPAPASKCWDDLIAQGKIEVPKNLLSWRKSYPMETLGISYCELSKRELNVISSFLGLLNTIPPRSERRDIYAKNVLRIFLREVILLPQRRGLFGGLHYVFSMGVTALRLMWFLTAYPKIRREYGLYLKNFRG